MLEQKRRVKLKRSVSLEPYTVLNQGEKGTVVHVEEDGAGVYEADILMDKYHKGLAPWDNVAHLVPPELSAVDWQAPSKFNYRHVAIVVLGVLSLSFVAGEAAHAFESFARLLM